MDIDKWTAEKLGLKTRINNMEVLCYQLAEGLYQEWTIQDARCRELIREHFKIDTNVFENGWIASTEGCFKIAEIYADTIAEAEISCLKAIYEAENGEK